MSLNFKSKLLKATELEKKKEEAFYATTYQGLYDNCMEEDRQILTLSAAGIGILVTVFYTRLSSYLSFRLWIIAVLLFIFDIFLIFVTFHHNQKLLHAQLKGEPILKKTASRSEILKMHITKKGVKFAPWLNFFTKTFFILGIFATFILAYYEGNLLLKQKESYQMTTEKKNSLDIFIDTDPNGDSKVSKK